MGTHAPWSSPSSIGSPGRCYFTAVMARAQKQGWAVVALDCAVDTTTPAGEAVANVLAVFAQFERRLISQRTREALAIKKAQGVRLGRRARCWRARGVESSTSTSRERACPRSRRGSTRPGCRPRTEARAGTPAPFARRLAVSAASDDRQVPEARLRSAPSPSRTLCASRATSSSAACAASQNGG